MEYYKNLTTELLANGIKPMATLYHWDLPMPLEDLGGFLNASFADWFNDYADKVFAELGENVSTNYGSSNLSNIVISFYLINLMLSPLW